MKSESESESSQSYLQECEVKLSSVEMHPHEVLIHVRVIHTLRREVRVLLAFVPQRINSKLQSVFSTCNACHYRAIYIFSSRITQYLSYQDLVIYNDSFP